MLKFLFNLFNSPAIKLPKSQQDIDKKPDDWYLFSDSVNAKIARLMDAKSMQTDYKREIIITNLPHAKKTNVVNIRRKRM